MLRILIILLVTICHGKALSEERGFENAPEARTSLIQLSEIKSEEIEALATLVNQAYLQGEEGICLPEMKRTSPEEMRTFIERGELIGLKISHIWRGCIHVSLSPYDKSGKSGLFGMLAIANEAQFRSKGYGTLLVQAAEEWARQQNYTQMMLELLQPTDWVQSHKKRLEDWYINRGYKPRLIETFPHPSVLLPGNYEFKIFSKDL